MDTNIYKFWENQLTNLNKGRTQMEDMTRCIMGGVTNFDEIAEKFGKFCNMDIWHNRTDDYIKAWETTTEEFQKLFRYYLNLMGMVPKDEYLELKNQYKDLNESINDRKKEISEQLNIIADQKKVISAQKKEISKQKKIITDQKKEFSVQKKLVAEQVKSIKNLQKQVGAK